MMLNKSIAKRTSRSLTIGDNDIAFIMFLISSRKEYAEYEVSDRTADYKTIEHWKNELKEAKEIEKRFFDAVTRA